MHSILKPQHLFSAINRSSRIAKNANIKTTVRLSSCNGGSNTRPRLFLHSTKSRSRLVATSKYSQSRNKTSLLKRRYRTEKAMNPNRSKSTSSMTSADASNFIGSKHTITSIETLIQTLRVRVHSKLLQSRTFSIPRWISPRPFTFNLSELFGHGSFILVAISYAMDDYLLLRITAVAGSTSMLFFTYFHPHGRVLWLPFRWNVMFIALNVYRIGSSLYESYMAELMDNDMRSLKEKHLTLMEKTDFVKLLKIATVEEHDADKVIVHQGEMNPFMRIIVEGDVDVFRDGVKTYVLTDGNFITEAGMHAGLEIVHGISSCCTIKPCSKSKNKVRCLRWNRTELVELCRKDKTLYRSLQFSLSWDIVRKLKAQRKFLITQEVEDPELWTIKRKEQSDSRYTSLLQNILKHNGHLENHRNEIAKYRSIHQIDDELHGRALKMCGWTPEEFDLGRKEGDEEKSSYSVWPASLFELLTPRVDVLNFKSFDSRCQ